MHNIKMAKNPTENMDYVYPWLEQSGLKCSLKAVFFFFLPEDVLSDSRECWDVLIVYDVSVQRRLCHQVGPCQ